MQKTLFTTIICLLSTAASAGMYKVTITNGTAMPISPGVVYTTANGKNLTAVGESASEGFTKLCQMGNAGARYSELMNNSDVHNLMQTRGPILPGESVEVQIESSPDQTVHFEAMYGKTKDSCAVAAISGRTTNNLYAGESLTVRDEVLVTGAFSDAMVAMYTEYCKDKKTAVECLRDLYTPATNGKIRFFSGHLPSVLNFLEEKYGSSDTQSLIVPQGGGLSIKFTMQ